MLQSVRKIFIFLLVISLMAGIFGGLTPGVARAEELTRLKSIAQPLNPRPEPSEKPSLAAAPSVSLSDPGEVLLGDNFKFSVTLDNKGGNPGYGPFIDLVLPTNGADGNFNRDVQDGITFVQASTHKYNFDSTETTLSIQKFPDGAGITCVSHPWARQSDGQYFQVCGPAGDTLVSLRLPFGALAPGQPAIPVEVEAVLSSLADRGVPLKIRARSGFLYGNDSLDNWCCGDTPIFSHVPSDSTNWPFSTLTPIVFTFGKSYLGPDNVQDETSSGPNFMRQYLLTMNIATGQTFSNLNLTDKLPDNEQFASLDSSGISPGYTVTSTPGTTAPGGKLELNFASAAGSNSAEDVKAPFNFYIPRLDAGGAPVINPNSGDDVLSENSAWMTADWVPSDKRDAKESLVSESVCVPGGVCKPLHTLQDKALAIQKSVKNITDDTNSPGDVLEYSLPFQVSDYFAFDNLIVTDLISDGQRVLPSFKPSLQILGNGYELTSAPFDSANYVISCNYSGGPGPECTASNPAADNGSTELSFKVSQEIITRGQNGRMIGGCVNPAGGLAAVCTPSSPGDGPTIGLVTFRTVIQDVFSNDYPSGDPSVDQGDKFTNQAKINGSVLDNNTFTITDVEPDDALAETVIPRKDLLKEIYAVNGETNSSNWPTLNGSVQIKPGDTVTYRMTYNLSTSDVEDLELEDYLPLSVFFAADPDADDNIEPKHDNGPAFVFDDITGVTPPEVGHAQFGPADTFRAYSGLIPTVSRNTAKNALRFAYGDYDNPANQPTVIDLLFTLTAASDIFADQAFITNEATEYEGSTNNGDFRQDAIHRIVLIQPALSTTKSVIWTNSTTATISPLPVGPVDFTAPGPAPRWSGMINSSLLAAKPINSSITGVQSGDTVSFAIVIENKGSNLAGAFDIIVRDIMPEIYEVPGSGLDLQIYYGNGTGPIERELNGVVTQADCLGGNCGPDNLANTPDDIFGKGIKLVDPVGSGVCQAYNPNLGNNIILVTYNLQVKKNVIPGTFPNTAIIKYANKEGGIIIIGGGDTADTSWIKTATLPSTGFAQGRVTQLPIQPLEARYTPMPNLSLEIPALNVNVPIVGVPDTSNGWNLTWLSNQAGYLQGTTPPTAVGNTALTAHVYLADGTPGPFVNLDQLGWGQTIILHADGHRYIYEVRQNQLVSPNNISVFREDGYAWLTLLTCKTYNESLQTYRYRVAVRAILLRVE